MDTVVTIASEDRHTVADALAREVIRLQSEAMSRRPGWVQDRILDRAGRLREIERQVRP